jgi:hypothetical protein
VFEGLLATLNIARKVQGKENRCFIDLEEEEK